MEQEMAPKRSRTQGSSSRAAARPEAITPATFGLRLQEQVHRDRFDTLCKRPIVPTRYLDFDLVNVLGIREDIDYLAESLHWSQFIHIQEVAYIGLVYEFLSTLEVQLLKGPNMREGLCTFRLDNRDRQLVLQEIAQIFYFRHVDHRDPCTEGQAVFCDVHSLWDAIADGQYSPKTSKATAITSPPLRLLHRFMTHTIFGRGEGGENQANKKEMIFLYAALHPGCRLNSAAFMMSHIHLVAARGAGSIAIGGLITSIARYFGINLENRLDAIPPLPIGAESLHKMGVLLVHRGIYYWMIDQARRLYAPLPDPARTSITEGRNWRLLPRPTDLTYNEILADFQGQIDEEAEYEDNPDPTGEDEDEDEDAEYAPTTGQQSLRSYMESQFTLITDRFSALDTRFTTRTTTTTTLLMHYS